jgi:hypothetical protein
MELRGLPGPRGALAALFPGHEFYGVAMRDVDGEPYDSFTSSNKPLARGAPNGNVGKIVEAMAGELVPGRRGSPPDLLMVLDDLELANKVQPDVVVDVFRDATVAHLQRLRAERLSFAERVESALLRKASFHLAVPMIEAWLFADPQGPNNAAVPAARLPPNWRATHDAEDFLTADPTYLADDCAACTAWQALPASKQRAHRPAWQTSQRDLHPKAFLAWLSRDPAEKKCSCYRETHEGAAALRSLDWAAALADPAHCTFLRALVADLADGLGQPPRFPLRGSAASLTSHAERRAAPVLRNI